MKAAKLLISIMLVVSFSLAAKEASALVPGQEAPPTCSGAQGFFGSQNYFFGFKDKGSCGVQSVYANSDSEAWSCARKLCPNCEIQDLTGPYQLQTPDLGDPKSGFCRK